MGRGGAKLQTASCTTSWPNLLAVPASSGQKFLFWMRDDADPPSVALAIRIRPRPGRCRAWKKECLLTFACLGCLGGRVIPRLVDLGLVPCLGFGFGFVMTEARASDLLCANAMPLLSRGREASGTEPPALPTESRKPSIPWPKKKNCWIYRYFDCYCILVARSTLLHVL